ncbi:MAG: 6-phosphofructokinase, partial [Candidatus Woesearchaeota archaeon]
NVIFIPTTIDNDIPFTDNSIGFDTAVSNNVLNIDNLKQTMSSNNRGFIVEVMGRNSGHIALETAVSSNAQGLIVPEYQNSYSEISKTIKKAISNGVKSPCVIVSENVTNIDLLAKNLENDTKKPFRTINFGHIQRGGSPSKTDRMLSFMYAKSALNIIKKNKQNEYPIVGVKNNRIVTLNFSDVEGLKFGDNFNNELYRLFKYKKN